MKPERKTEIREVAARATPPPWRTDLSGKTVSGFTCDVVVAAVARGQAVYCTPAGGTYPENDRRFIALAREAVPELLAEVDRLEAALAHAETTRLRELETCLRYAKSLRAPDRGMRAEIAEEFVGWLGSRLRADLSREASCEVPA